jgi:hypothetical protein
MNEQTTDPKPDFSIKLSPKEYALMLTQITSGLLASGHFTTSDPIPVDKASFDAEYLKHDEFTHYDHHTQKPEVRYRPTVLKTAKALLSCLLSEAKDHCEIEWRAENNLIGKP